MGNRAVVVFKDKNDIGPAIYLHWNGGPESIMAFLLELKRRGQMGHSVDYSAARFVCIVGEFFRGMGENYSTDGHSLGVSNGPKGLSKEELSNLSPGDNGVYVVDITCEELTVSWNGKKITETSLPKILKEQGKGYTEGYQDKPVKQFEGIQEFFLDLENLLKRPRLKSVKGA